jgi:C-terminal processing protease CtpA/Prc
MFEAAKLAQSRNALGSENVEMEMKIPKDTMNPSYKASDILVTHSGSGKSGNSDRSGGSRRSGERRPLKKQESRNDESDGRDDTISLQSYDAYSQALSLQESSIIVTNPRSIRLANSSLTNETMTPRESSRNRVYDCFAPPGPLGIVIDTSPEGPIIHSMKTTSPLLGLINQGDLIVGLDGIDTRSMTAATLTRLMAKRSQQAQRKITLLGRGQRRILG